MYDGDTLIWGTEPDGTTAKPTQPASKGSDENPIDEPVSQPSSSESDTVLYGDANLDGKVSISDAVRILQYIANGQKYALEEQGLINADVDGKAGVTGSDAMEIQKYDAKVISKFVVEN